MSLLPVDSTDVSDGAGRYEADIPLERTGSFGYTVRVLPKNPLLASEAELGVLATA
jgi:starch phosphorylase